MNHSIIHVPLPGIKNNCKRDYIISYDVASQGIFGLDLL